MNKPVISVVVPVYNAEKYLTECIASVLAQSFPDWELVLVNDGSKDGSGEICDAYAGKDSRIRVIHKANAGPTAARTDGAEAATGKYVTFLDSDDKLAPALLQVLADILDGYGVEAILFDAKRFGAGEEIPMPTLLPPGVYRDETLIRLQESLILSGTDEVAILYGVCCKVFLREKYLHYQKKVPPVLYIGEDLAVSAPLLADCASVYVSNFCGYFYRDTPGSLMNTFRPETIAQIPVLAEYLAESMGQGYQSRIDNYVVTHLFDYLDRAVAAAEGYRAYRAMAKAAFSAEFRPYLNRGVCKSPRLMNRLAFFLTKHRMGALIWVLRKIKKRKP